MQEFSFWLSQQDIPQMYEISLVNLFLSKKYRCPLQIFFRIYLLYFQNSNSRKYIADSFLL